MGFNCPQVNTRLTDSLLRFYEMLLLKLGSERVKAQCCSMSELRDDQQYAVDKSEQRLALMANGGTIRHQIVLSEDHIVLLSLFISDL